MEAVNRIKELDAIRKDIEPWIENMARGMDESAICFTIFTKDYAKGIDSLLQFAVSIMLDKPIFLLVPMGVHVPELVKKVAVAIEFYETDNRASMEAATMKLLRVAKEKSLTA
jgi:hypothetical protein